MASKTSQISQDITAEQVVQFLEAHPDFLDQRPELLAKLRFSHHIDGATSLIERQIQMLREDQQAARLRFEHLAANAELNQRLLEKIEKFTVELLDCRNAQPMISRAHHLLKELFGLTGSYIAIAEQTHTELGKGVDRCSSDELRLLQNQVGKATVYMGSPPEKLENPPMASFGSVAIVPLVLEAGSGYLLLGSGDENRFKEDMGSDFLVYIATLIGRLMDRLE